MDDELALFWIHTAPVQTYQGSGMFGDTWAPAVDVPCFIDHTRKLVRDMEGREVISEATITGPLIHAAKFTPQSLVTLDGRDRTVLSVASHHSGALGLPDHFEVTTT